MNRQAMKNVPGPRVRAAGILLMVQPPAAAEFLLLRHPNRWDLPKGHCEAGESFQAAALRETEEETGIPSGHIVLDQHFVFELTYPMTYKGSPEQTFEKQVRYYLGYLSQKPELSLTEHQDARWFSWSPPHQIQSQTIDPLLAAVALHLDARSAGPA